MKSHTFLKNNKNTIAGLLVVLIVVGGFYGLNAYIYHKKQALSASDYKNAEYTIAGNPIRLIGGKSEIAAAPGSSSKIITTYFGNEIKKDLNNDGREDVVFLLTQTTGGTGVFFYVVAALATDNGYVGSQGLLLGDRIAPQTTESGGGRTVIVNYADRNSGESMITTPSVGKSLKLIFDITTMQFGEVAQNFEGEANVEVMNLGMKKWVWVRANYSDNRVVTPKKPETFTISFTKDGEFTVRTDCNTVNGIYMINRDKDISFGQMISTKMACASSQEELFVQLLRATEKYHFTSKGELIFDLKSNIGTVTFR